MKKIDLDMERCCACGACAIACMDQNNIEPEEGMRPFRTVFRDDWEEDGKAQYFSIACMHCDNAPCVLACPVGCIYKDAQTGYTLFDNTVFKDAVYEADISGALIILTSNYSNEDEMKERLGLPIFYRIDKFIRFEDFDSETIFKIVQKELDDKYDEYKEYFSKEEIYSLVSNRILNTGENARTIKNKIQAVIEDQLFEKFLKNGEDQSIVTEEGA